MEEPAEEFSARAYQVDLYEKAALGNKIVFLPTGSGKTFIAVLLIKKLSNAVLKPYNDGGKRTIFIVNTVALVEQQTKFLARHTSLTCAGYSGDRRVDFWTRDKWMHEVEINQIMVFTAQIFLDILAHGYMSLSKVNLIIFDECHHAVKVHPMRQIMQHFENYSKDEQPRVLAMTASLLNSNVDLSRVDKTIQTLETTFRATIATVDSLMDVASYSTNPSEIMVMYDKPSTSSVIDKVTILLEAAKGILDEVHIKNESEKNDASLSAFKPRSKKNKFKAILTDILEQYNKTGLYGCSKATLLHIIQLECLRKSANDQETVIILGYLVTQLSKIRKLLEDEMKDFSESDQIHRFSCDQVLKLFTVLKNFDEEKSNDQKLCCIIFVQQRYTAEVLYHVLKSLHRTDERYHFLLPEFIVGFSNDPYKTARESMCMAKWNKIVLAKLRSGQSNCVVATDVVDEGLDVADCTLVVRFDLPSNVRAYIQSKGRARHSTSRYVMLVPSIDTSFIKKYDDYNTVENHIKEILIGKTDMREDPSEDQIQKELYDSLIQPYTVTNEDGEISVVTGGSAINLVNRYCAMLYKSKFISLTPTWQLNKAESNEDKKVYQVTLEMPSVSPLKTVIKGDWMTSIKLAKRSASIKCCIELHMIGELTENLLPKKPAYILDDIKHLFPKWVEEEKIKTEMPGTYAKKRQYKLVNPEQLYAAFPKEGVDSYLHIINAKPTYPVPTDNQDLVFYNLLDNSAGFAILSTKRMPELSSFPIFMNIGKLSVDIMVNYATLQLTAEEIENLRTFHMLIFSKLVEVVKIFMLYDKDNLNNSFLVVPIDDERQINWDVTKRYQCINYIKPTKPINFNVKDYETALIAHSYRRSKHAYIVTRVCEELFPDSEFPSSDFNSYKQYFAKKYGLHVEEDNQPLLEVKAISMNINCLKERGKSGSRKRKISELGVKEHLVPELCMRIDFPALYWLKSMTLPTIIHRISQLLVAEQLRVSIHNDTGLGIMELPPNRKWRSLTETGKKIGRNSPESRPESLDICSKLSEPQVLNFESRTCPWPEDQEPVDLDRNAENVNMDDIEYYIQFHALSSDDDDKILDNMLKAPGYMAKPSVPVPSLKLLQRFHRSGPSQVNIMQALTTKLGNDVFNLERLETLGDSFLKFSISLFLTENFPTYNEGQLTFLKGKIIGNRNLYYCGNEKDIPGMMKVQDFQPTSNFIAPAITVHRELQHLLQQTAISPSVLYELEFLPEERLQGILSQSVMDQIKEKVSAWDGPASQSGLEHFLGVQTVSDKMVADCVEALIGVYLTSMGLIGAAQLLLWFGILPENVSIATLLLGSPSSPRLGEGDPNFHIVLADLIEARLGYKFNDRAYLLQAFTHPSYAPNAITACYQRLEFLGDAVLDFLITIHIYEECGNLSPGQLTDLRSALVNNITFACLAVRYGLHSYLLAYAPKLNTIIDRFVQFQEERNHVVDDELLRVLLKEDDCNMAEYVDVPKVLGDLFESVAGAIFLDSGKDLNTVWEIFYALMHKEIAMFSKNVPKQAIRAIYETKGANPKFSESSKIDGTDTVMVSLRVTVSGERQLFHGFGANKKQAKCAAAKQALKYLRFQELNTNN